MNVVCIDVETGGLDASKNPITQVALISINVDSMTEISRFKSYALPYDNLELDPKALDYTGITIEKLKEHGVEIKSIYKSLVEEFKKSSTNKRTGKVYLLGHNIGFDQSFLEYIFKAHGDDIYKHVQDSSIDTLSLARAMWAHDSTMSKFDLETCCNKVGIELIDAHDAMNDVIATLELYKYFVGVLQSNRSNMDHIYKDRPKERRTRDHFQI